MEPLHDYIFYKDLNFLNRLIDQVLNNVPLEKLSTSLHIRTSSFLHVPLWIQNSLVVIFNPIQFRSSIKIYSLYIQPYDVLQCLDIQDNLIRYSVLSCISLVPLYLLIFNMDKEGFIWIFFLSIAIGCI